MGLGKAVPVRASRRRGDPGTLAGGGQGELDGRALDRVAEDLVARLDGAAA